METQLKNTLDDGALLQTDFASLHVLKCVHDQRSIRGAAEMLEKNQSTVSYTIDRLRQIFGDPLFVRLGRGIEPTPRCTAIVKGAEELLQRFQALLTTEEFDPTVSNERFVLSCNFYERSIFLPKLMQRVRREAPNVRIVVIQANSEGHRHLENGDCDVVIAPLTAETSGIYARELIRESYACFVAPDSRFTREPLTLEAYSRAKHILVRHAPHWRPYYRETLDRLGVSLDIVLEVPSFGIVDHIIENCDLIFTASAGFERIFCPRLTMIPAPFDCDFPIRMYWSSRTHKSPAHIWFRSMIQQVADNLRFDT